MISRKMVVLLALGAMATTVVSAGDTAPTTDTEKTLYTMGHILSQRLAGYGLTAEEVAVVQRGFADGMLGKEPAATLDNPMEEIQTFLNAKQSAKATELEAEGKEFRDRMAAEEGAIKTDSGLIYFVEEEGTGASPDQTASVKLNYHGTFPDGTAFDSTRLSGEPATFSLGRVVPCFQEGVSTMKVGGKSKLVCAPDLAYGDRGSPPKVPPGATLVFEIELLEIVEAPAMPQRVLPPPKQRPTP